jgi:hypothetical protein
MKDILAKLAAINSKPLTESVQLVTELSKNTLGSYVKKADNARAEHSARAETFGYNDHGDKEFNKAEKRGAGVRKAVDKLVKDDVQVDETWETDKGSYKPMTKKASAEFEKEKARISASEKKGRDENDRHIANGTIKPDFPKGNPFHKKVGEAAGATKFGVFMSGGSVGEKNDAPKKTFDSKEEAIAFAKRRNSQLTPGERGYYKMKYTVRPVKAEPVDEAKNTPWPKNQALKKPMTDADHKAWQQQQKDEKKAASLARKKANESTGELDEAPSLASMNRAAEYEWHREHSKPQQGRQFFKPDTRKAYIAHKETGEKVGDAHNDFMSAQKARAAMPDAHNYKLVKEDGTDIDEATAKAPGLDHVYPDNKKGVLEYLQHGYNPRFLKDLDLATCEIHPDPQVRGVWAVDSMASGYRCIIYLAGYPTPYGDIRERSDNEEGGFPMSMMKQMVTNDRLNPQLMQQWVKRGGLQKEDMAKLVKHYNYINSIDESSYSPPSKDQPDPHDQDDPAPMITKESKVRKTFKVVLEGATLNLNDSGLAKVLRRFPHETSKFKAGEDLDDHLFDALYDHYLHSGEMPYGTAKARDGDPYEWVTQKLDAELAYDTGLTESGSTVNPELQAILKKYPHEAKQFEEFGELDDGPMYEEFFDHYLNAGEMPYGVAKARTGDPVQWVAQRLEQDLGLNPENPDPGYMDSAEELSSHERYEPPMEGMGGDIMPAESIGEDSLDPTPDAGTVIVEGLEKVIANILKDAGFDEGLDFFFENGLVVIGKSTAVAVMNVLRSNPQIKSHPKIEGIDFEEVRIGFGDSKELGEGLADDFAAMANGMKNKDGSQRFNARIVTPQQKQDERAALDAKRAADAAARPPVAPGPDTTNNGSFGDNRGYGQGRYMGDSKINKGNMLNESKAKTRQQKVDCPECNGTGEVPKKSYNNMQAETCSHCGGSGKVNPKVNEDANMNLSVSGTDDVLAVLRKLSGLDDTPAMGGMDAAPEDDMMGMEPQASEPSMRDMMGMMDEPAEDPAMDAEPEMGDEPELAPEVPSEEPSGDMEMSAPEPEVEVEEDYANEPHEKILPGYGTARGDKDGQGRRYPMTNPGNNPMANESKTAQLMRDYQTMLKGMKAK